MAFRHRADHDLAAVVRPERQHDAVVGSHQPVGLGALAVDLDLAAVAQLLGLGARARQARDIEPDVEPDSIAHGPIVAAAAGRCRYNRPVPTPLLLVFLVAVASATLLGGAVPLRFDRHGRLFLFFSAGALIALALVELIPEGLAGSHGAEAPRMVLVVGAFLATMLLDKLHVLHPHEHGMDAACPPTEHEHPPLAMHGAIGLIVHSAVDGLALAAAGRGSLAAAVTVALALAAHKFADGLTTVSLVLAHHHRKRQAVRLLAANTAVLLVGFAVGMAVPLGEQQLAGLLLVMAGFFLYLGATDLIPSLATPRCRKRDVLATAAGMAIVAALALLVPH